MASTAAGALGRWQSKIAALAASQTSNAAAAIAAGDAAVLALLEAIFDEIHENAKATGTDSNGDTHNLSIV